MPSAARRTSASPGPSSDSTTRKDIRYCTHLAEDLAVPTVVGEGVHQSLALAGALGHGRKFVPSLVEAPEQLAGTQIIPR